MGKPRVIKDFEKLDKDLQARVLEAYPDGFIGHLINYTDPKTGLERFALPFETEDRYYMVRVDELIESQIDRPSAEDSDSDSDLINLGNIETTSKPEELNDEEDDEEDDKTEFVSLDELEKEENEDEDNENE